MYDEMLESWMRVNAVWMRFVRRGQVKHSLIMLYIARNGPCSLAEIARAVDREPKSVRDDLKKLGDATAHGNPGDRLVEKCRLEDRKGLFFQLTVRGRLAIQEVLAAQEEPEDSGEWSPCDGEEAHMLDDWMASRSFVRG